MEQLTEVETLVDHRWRTTKIPFNTRAMLTAAKIHSGPSPFEPPGCRVSAARD